jgi:micrococcal nuclease
MNMSGWRLYDIAFIQGKVSDHVFYFPQGFVLRAGQSVTIYSGSGVNTESSLYWGRLEGEYGAIWTNDGDCAYLEDNQGNLVDMRCWTIDTRKYDIFHD